jgi:hypothetical protein
MWDIILIVALAILEGMYLIIPFMLVRSQKKSYKKQNFASMDYLQIKIDENSSVESLHKDGEEVARNVHNLRNLTSYLEDSEVLVMVFNKVEYVCIKKDKLVGDLNKLKAHLEKVMAKTVNNKKQLRKQLLFCFIT